MIKVFFPICTITYRVMNYVCRQGEGTNKTTKTTIGILITVSFPVGLSFGFTDFSFLFNQIALLCFLPSLLKVQNSSFLTTAELFTLRGWQHQKTSESW